MVEAAVVRREEAHILSPLSGRRGAVHQRKWKPAGWTGRCFHFGDGKEAFDPGAYTIFRTPRVFKSRGETGAHFTVFPDVAVAIIRATTDSAGPG